MQHVTFGLRDSSITSLYLIILGTVVSDPMTHANLIVFSMLFSVASQKF